MPNKIAKKILQSCMGLKKSESFLVVTDRLLFELAGEFFRESQKITKRSRLITIDIPEVSGTEPHPDVAKMIRDHDVSLLITTRSLSHTRARKEASKKGARIASMPGLKKEMITTALSEDFSKLQKINKDLSRKISGKKEIRIITKKGTDISFGIKKRTWIEDSGIYNKKGDFGNLPAGEVFIAPLEGTTKGKLIVDGSVAGLGLTKKDLILRFEKGLLVSLSGGKMAKQWALQLKDDRYRNVAELGIGTNRRAKITGEVLEDEKVLGTIHLALGNNAHFGGKIDVPYHIDCVVKNPTIFADGKTIMKEGKLLN